MNCDAAPHGSGGVSPPAGCKASGENGKAAEDECLLSTLAAFRFHCARGGGLAIPPPLRGTSLSQGRQQSLRHGFAVPPPFHKGGSNPSVTASLRPLPFTREALVRKNVCFPRIPFSQKGCRANGPAAGVQGLRKPLIASLPLPSPRGDQRFSRLFLRGCIRAKPHGFCALE